MAEKKEHKRKFPWRTPRKYYWRRYTDGRTYSSSSNGIWDAHTARFFHTLFGSVWLLPGILFFSDVLIMVICFSITGISRLVALYAHLSIREEERIAAEEQAAIHLSFCHGPVLFFFVRLDHHQKSKL